MTPEENVARMFHHHYERLAPQFGWKTQDRSAVAWEDLPEENRELMIATIEAVFTPMGSGVFRLR